MRRRQVISLQALPKPAPEIKKKKILVIDYDSMYDASVEKGECVICGQKISSGIYFHFNAHWNRIREHISGNEK